MIQPYVHNTRRKKITLTVGMWVNVDSHLYYAFAGQAGRITKVTPESVLVGLYTVDTDQVQREVLRRKSSIGWVSDSLEEAQRVISLSRAHTRHSDEVRRQMGGRSRPPKL